MTHNAIRSIGSKELTRAFVHGMIVVLSMVAIANARSASASVIFVAIDPDRVLQDSNFIWDVDNDGEKDLIISQAFGCLGNCLTSAHASALSGGIVMATATDVAPLSAGAIIGPGSTFGGFGLMASDRFSNNPPMTLGEEGLWDDGLTAFLGFSFANASGTHYGWARVKVDEMTNIITVFDAAYEDAPDTAIAVDAVPEAASVALGLVGLAGFTVRRWRRRAI